LPQAELIRKPVIQSASVIPAQAGIQWPAAFNVLDSGATRCACRN